MILCDTIGGEREGGREGGMEGERGGREGGREGANSHVGKIYYVKNSTRTEDETGYYVTRGA